ncbi:MAG TPA: hypothetical protein VN659_14465 [Pyrinomonadaceae bacterium]|nr:hypothetical protein [Pyrinomonadaceae bacterium]
MARKILSSRAAWTTKSEFTLDQLDPREPYQIGTVVIPLQYR